MRTKELIQLVQHDTGSNPHRPPLQVQVGDLPVVPREINDHALTANLHPDNMETNVQLPLASPALNIILQRHVLKTRALRSRTLPFLIAGQKLRKFSGLGMLFRGKSAPVSC